MIGEITSGSQLQPGGRGVLHWQSTHMSPIGQKLKTTFRPQIAKFFRPKRYHISPIGQKLKTFIESFRQPKNNFPTGQTLKKISRPQRIFTHVPNGMKSGWSLAWLTIYFCALVDFNLKIITVIKTSLIFLHYPQLCQQYHDHPKCSKPVRILSSRVTVATLGKEILHLSKSWTLFRPGKFIFQNSNNH